MFSTKELEEYVRGVLGVTFVQFGSMDYEVSKELVEVLERAFSEYPLLKRIFHSILIEEEVSLQKNYFYYRKKSIFFGISYFKEKPLKEGIIISKFVEKNDLKTLDASANTWIHAKGCKSLKGKLWHELGYIIDDLLKVSTSQELYDLFLEKKINRKQIIKDISVVGSISPQEFIAECFAEYYCGENPHPCVLETMECINKKYKMLEQEEILKLKK